jgi:hypothetical protein
MKSKLSIKNKTANLTLKVDGDDKTEGINTENRKFQIAMDSECGLFCETCDQFKAGLCFGCYNGCLNEWRTCTSKNCDELVEFNSQNAKGEPVKLQGHCPVRCCKRTGLDEWLNDVSQGRGSDLSIKHIKWEPVSFPKMGHFIPAINGHIERVYVPYIALPVNYLYSEKTHKMRGGKKSVHDMYDIHPDTEVIVTGYCQDPVLEDFWTNMNKEYLMERLREKGVSVVMGFNYSLYHGDPRMEHLINIRRCFEIMKRAEMAGLKSIPDICWHNSADMQQFVEWINTNKVTTVSTSTQCCRENSYIAKNIYDLDYLMSKCPDVKRWIINGPSTPSRIRLFAQRFPKMVLMSSRACQLAKYNMVWDYKCNEYVKCVAEDGSLISRADAFMINCRFFDDVVAGVGLDKFGQDYFEGM